MLAFVQALSFWDWLALGTILLIFEVFGPAATCCGSASQPPQSGS